MIETPVLEGSRVRLEPLRDAHFEQLEQVAFDERIWRYMLVWVRTREDLRAWMDAALREAATGNALIWVTVAKEDGRVAGSTRLFDLDMTHRRGEIGHTWLAPRYHGVGLNAEAKLLQLRFAFETLGLNRVALKTHHENRQSQAAMRKLGAVEEGTFRNHCIMPDGSVRHTVWFSITREEWPQVQSRLEERVRQEALRSV
jgi:RimJ/RimL family protein N-acetyltransferase